MSCAGKGYGKNPQSDAYLYSQFSNSVDTIKLSSRSCRQYNGFYPSFTPILNGLSVTSSQSGIYSLVYVSGANFLPNSTFIQFGNYSNLPVIYYNSFNLSFVVPLNAVPGIYTVKVVNIYNGNFSPPIRYTYPGNLNYSDSINYTIT